MNFSSTGCFSKARADSSAVTFCVYYVKQTNIYGVQFLKDFFLIYI